MISDFFPEMKLYIQQTPSRIAYASEFKKTTKKQRQEEEDNDDVENLELTPTEMLMEAQQETVKRYRAVNILGMVRGDASRQAALNFPFQSLAAVISKQALWLVYLDGLRCGYKIVSFIHNPYTT